MNYLKILNENQKREIENQLKKQFGITEIPGIIVQRGGRQTLSFHRRFQ